MKKILFGLLALSLTTIPSTLHAASIGDPAPPMTIERWVKGTPVAVGPGNNIYVVEFWATWCGPCKVSIPHLSELQRKYGSQGVVFIGVSDEPVDTVAPFVASQGDGMAYRVAVDSTKRTFNAWMTAYGESGIPHSFVVGTNGVVLWHGHPTGNLDRTLERILAGTFDLEKAKNFEAGDRGVDYYAKLATQSRKADQAKTLGEKLLADYSMDWRVPHRLAKAILTDPALRFRDLELALRATTLAVEKTHEHSSDAMAMHARAL